MKPQPDPLKPELPGLGLPLKRIPDADEIHPKGTKRFPTALGSSLDLGYREEGEAAYVNPSEPRSVHPLTAPAYL